jgi:thioesterase domain-containing protein/acyl carrier protein
MKDKKIEAIYPLTFLQQSLLIHGLSNKENDQGFIQVTCRIKGPLNLELLKQSWQTIVDRHPAFRTSFHWEKIKKPVQAVHAKATIKWKYLDLSGKKRSAAEQSIEKFRSEDKSLGINFMNPPISRCALIKLNQEEHQLIWTCHHILFDGWSGFVVLQEVLKCYDTLNKNEVCSQEHIPTYKSYIDWISGLDPDLAKQHWTHYLNGVKNPTLISKLPYESSGPSDLLEQRLVLPATNYKKLNKYLKTNRITLSTYLRTSWGLLLGCLCDSDDVIFGATVSGRSMDFPQIEKIVGLFMNVLPVRLKFNSKKSLPDLMRVFQDQQFNLGSFEYVNQKAIHSWIGWDSNLPLFNSLLVIQNLAANDLRSDTLDIMDMKGKITSVHPLTLIAEVEDSLQITLRYDTRFVNETLIAWIFDSLKIISQQLVEGKQTTAGAIRSLLPAVPILEYKQINGASAHLNGLDTRLVADYVGPKDPVELNLVKVWEGIMGRYPIGVNDNFFETGGDSFMAIKLITKIERIFDKTITPMSMIQYPTVRSMAESWKSTTKPVLNSSLVPIRANGSKPPLFVIHGGGGHIFFTYPMAKHLDPDQPVYALQPVGLFGDEEMLGSIEAMAGHYLETIRSIQPDGQFSILGSCLGDPICVEMNKQLRKKGKSPLALIIVDSYPEHLFPRKIIRTPRMVRWNRFKERFRQSPYRAIRKMFVDRMIKLSNPFKLKWEEFKIIYGSDEQARKLRSIQNHLQTLYFRYFWEPFNGKVTLIKTSQNVERINNRSEDVWKKLASDGIDLIVTPGKHFTRFDEPDVIELSRRLQNHLDRLYQQQGIDMQKTTVR